MTSRILTATGAAGVHLQLDTGLVGCIGGFGGRATQVAQVVELGPAPVVYEDHVIE